MAFSKSLYKPSCSTHSDENANEEVLFYFILAYTFYNILVQKDSN